MQPYETPLWPARLDHFRLDTPDPAGLAEFYRDAMGMTPVRLDRDWFLLRGSDRRVLIGKGERNVEPFAAFTVATAKQLAVLRDFVAAKEVTILPSPTPLLEQGAFAVRDPDGRLVIFGLAGEEAPAPVAKTRAARLPARLQHLVVATVDVPALARFYTERLGFLIADTVYAGAGDDHGEAAAVTFFRADTEHHSFAAFGAPSARLDHHSYETTCWNDIRDWLDHFADMGLAPWWGPGRHGLGRNLFFMVKDPDGNNIELSAEIEIMPRYMPGRRWPNVRQTINAWGAAWNRMESDGKG